MNSYDISSVSLIKSYQTWLNDNESLPCVHYLDGVRLKEGIDQRVSTLRETYLLEHSGIGGAIVFLYKEDKVLQELNTMESIQQALDGQLHPVVGIVAAFDIACPDHNDSIRCDVIQALENRSVVIATKSLIAGAGSDKVKELKNLHNKLKEREKEYYYWIDDSSQYVVMIPKRYGPEMKRAELLGLLDFSPSKWIKIDSTSLIESTFAKPHFDRFLNLFTDEPKARKQWVLCGHGGAEHVCGMGIEDYKRLYAFLKKQNTQFAYVSSCQSGGHKGFHQQESSFPVVLGTYTGEDHYSIKCGKQFFHRLNGILSSGIIRSVRPFEKLFCEHVTGGKNESIIFLPDSTFPFQLLRKDQKGKDLYQVDLTRAKCEKKPLDLTEQEKVCIHPSHLDVEVVVGEKIAIFPYHSGDWIELDQLRSGDSYFEFLKSFYNDISLQKGCFHIHDLNGQKEILWVLEKNQSREWHLPTIGIKDAVAIRDAVGEAKFNEKVLPLLSEECRRDLLVYHAILQKGGIDLDPTEDSLFKKNWKLIVETLVKSGQCKPGLIERLMKSKAAKSHLLWCCIKCKRMDQIIDFSPFKTAIGKSHFQEAARLGDISLFNILRKLNPHQMPTKLSDILIYSLEGGEEMMIELYQLLKLSPDSECYPGRSLFTIGLDLGWTQFVAMMMESGKPKGKSLMTKDSPLNLLIDANQQDSTLKPLVIKAIREGWNESEFDEYGHRELPLNRLMRLGQFDLFMELLSNIPREGLEKLTYYLPLSEAIEQYDSRYLEILLSLKVFNVNAEVSPGVPLLCKAIKLGNDKAVESLIQNGAKLHLPDYILDQPLSLALKLGDKRIIKLLLQYGAHEIGKEDHPRLIELIKEFKNDEEMVWQLMFLAYRKPSLYGAKRSSELVQYFYKNGMRAQVQWIISRNEKQQQYNAGLYLEMFVSAGDRQMVQDYLKFQGKIENKAAIARVLKKALQENLEEPVIIELLEIELSRF